MKYLLLTASMVLSASGANANEYKPAMEAFLENQVRSWANSPQLVAAIQAQNTDTADLTEAQILEMDRAWRAEVGTSNTPTISPVMTNSAAEFLRSQVDASGGVITEVFAMDARGLNVAASDVTSDYWQGDEAKFSMTYPNGPQAVYFGEIEFDESTQTYQGQISIVVTDPATNAPIGALTIGVNAEALL